MPKIARTHEQLEEKLRQQFGFLVRSANAYDEGENDEAVRLATTLRVLVHDAAPSTSRRPTSVSLLTQLGIRGSLQMIDSRLPEGFQQGFGPIAMLGEVDGVLQEVGRRYSARLVRLIEPGGIVKYEPLFDQHPGNPAASVDDWLKNSEVIWDGVSYTRWDLIRIMANQDGGAHVDPELDEAYAKLCSRNLGYQTAVGNWLMEDPPGGWTEAAPSNVVEATVRQVVQEMVRTLEAAVPQILGG